MLLRDGFDDAAGDMLIVPQFEIYCNKEIWYM